MSVAIPVGMCVVLFSHSFLKLKSIPSMECINHYFSLIDEKTKDIGS